MITDIITQIWTVIKAVVRLIVDAVMFATVWIVKEASDYTIVNSNEFIGQRVGEHCDN